MLNTYQIFKMILGLVAAAFILVASVQIASTYSSSQQAFRGSVALSTLIRTAGDVQRTGNPAALAGLPAFDVAEDALLSGPDRFSAPLALLVAPGDALFLDAQKLDLGWWSFRTVSATPESTFVFAFLSADPKLLSPARKLLSALPDSQGFSPTISYSLCSGSALATALCNSPCERESFRPLLAAPEPSACSATLPQSFHLIMFSDSCPTSASSDRPTAAPPTLCIEPTQPNGLVPATLRGIRYLAKDPLDLAALAINSDRAFETKNRHFSRELALAARARSAQARLLAAQYALSLNRGTLAEGSDAAACIPLYRAFADAAEALPPLLAPPAWYREEPAILAVTGQLAAIRSAHQQLTDGGCAL